MSNVTGFVSSLFLSIGLAVVVTLVLRRPLVYLLIELCGNERRARFWAAFAAVTLVLGSLLGGLFSLPPPEEPAWEGAVGLRALLVGLRSSTFLLLAVIFAMGLVLVGAIRTPNDRRSVAEQGPAS